jgi:hypothetical protein
MQQIEAVERFITLHQIILRGHISSQEVRLLLESTLILLEALLADLKTENRLPESESRRLN